jgi:hypothetical protein
MYDAGYHNIVNIDYSETVISAMKERHCVERPNMEWRVMDMTDLSELADETFDVVIDKAAMDAMMAVEGDVWNPSQIWYWTKRSPYVNTCRESWFRVVTFCKYHWRKFIHTIIATDYYGSTIWSSWTMMTHTNYPRLLLYFFLTDKHIFANFTCWDGTRTQLLIDRTIRIRTRFGWSFRADTANKGFPRPMPLVISCMSWPKRDDRQSDASCIYLFCT